MLKFKSIRMTVPVVLAAAIILLAGGGAVASNMGFKLNKPIVNAALTSAVGDNWTSIPYNNPYGTFGGFCNQTGLRTVVGSAARISKINPANNSPTSATCGTAGANSVPLPTDGTGILIEQPVNTAAPNSIIIVGSHDPAKNVSILPFCNTTAAVPAYCATAPVTGQGLFWASVPYHSTSVTFRDFCNQHNLSRTVSSTATLSRINATTGLPQTSTCFSGASTGINLVLGEALQIKEVAAKSFIPAHY